MTGIFYCASVLAVAATILFVTALNAVHALLYLVVSLVAVALVVWCLGAPFAAALEIIIYAGAIMVLFVLVVMMVRAGPEAIQEERRWMVPRGWWGPVALGLLLVAVVVIAAWSESDLLAAPHSVGPKEVGTVLLGRYLLGVELASMLLLPGILAACHLGRRREEVR